MSTLEIGPPATDKQYANTCFALFIAGALVGVVQLSARIPFGDGFEMVALAKNLANHGSFGNPFLVLNTGPSAANPPLYPFLLAVLMKVFRIPALILAMASVGNIIMNALTASLLPRVSRRFYGDTVPGVVASILWLGSVQLMPAWDVGYTTTGLLVFCLCSAPSVRTPNRLIAIGVLEGTIAGLLFLFNPSSLLITIPWAAYLAFRRRMLLKEAAVLLAITFLIMFAWMARNHRQLGALVARTNLGMTLYASNNDCAQPSMVADQANNCYQAHHPNTSLSEARLLVSMGEVKYDRKRTADTEQWIKSHPARFFHLMIERARDFWFPPLQRMPYTSCFIWVTTLFSIPGLTLMIRRRHPVSLFMLAVLLIYPLMYYIVVSDVRYRYPVLWLSLLPAGYCIQQLLPERFKVTLAGELAGATRL